MEFGQKFRNFRRELGSFTCPKAGTWDRLFYFPSEGRHAVDFSSPKNPTASVGSEPAISHAVTYDDSHRQINTVTQSTTVTHSNVH
jgi:hypothetical protein